MADSLNNLWKDFGASRIGLGCWPLGGGESQVGVEALGRGDITENQAISTIQTACRCKINFFDTADIYGFGQSEKVLGLAFKRKWGNNLVATKVGKVVGSDGEIMSNFTPNHILRSVEGSLRRLQKDTIDLLQLHNPLPKVVRDEKTLACLGKLQEQGKIRQWGVSARVIDEAIEMLENGFHGFSLQVVFNLLRQEAAAKLFPLARGANVGIICRVPLEYGVLTGKFHNQTSFKENDHRLKNLKPRLALELDRMNVFRQLLVDTELDPTIFALRFCLSFPEVVTVIPGARTPEQVSKNALAVQMGPLGEPIIKKARELFALT
jgi:aryl-alcohol dehydrogenase-like predicted oxidoreductase